MTYPERPHLLFVCSRNLRRSRTAEDLYRNDPRCEVRSAGTAASAARRVTAEDLAWADVVLAMEQHHIDQLRDRFAGEMPAARHVDLDIPDDYQRGDPALVEALELAVEGILVALDA